MRNVKEGLRYRLDLQTGQMSSVSVVGREEDVVEEGFGRDILTVVAVRTDLRGGDKW